MRHQRKILAFLLFTGIGPWKAQGDDASPATLEWNNTWTSTYSTSLGGSQTAHAFNEDALYANPAALSKTRHPRSRRAIDVIDVPGLSIGGNRSTLSALKGKTLLPSEWLKSFAGKSVTDRNYLVMQMLPWTVIGERGGPAFFVGFPIRSALVAETNTADGLSRTIMTETTASAALNISVANRTGTAAFGLSLRPNIRWNSSAAVTLADIVSSKILLSGIKSEAHRTTSTPIDFGFIVTAADFWLPSFAFSVLNAPTACVDNFVNPTTGKTQSICGARRSGGVTDTLQGSRLDPTEVRAGLSIIPRFRVGTARLNLKVSADVYPLPITYRGKNYGYTDVHLNQLTHAGIELFLGNAFNGRAFSLRGGLNETRVSWGFSIPMPHVSLEMSSYEAALFTDGKASKDRRYLLGISSDW